MTDEKQLGQRIRAVRNKRRLTQEQVAEMAGLNAKYWSDLELGNETISVRNLKKVAVALDVPLAELVSAEHEMPRAELEKEVQKMVADADDAQLKTIYRILAAVVR